MFRIERYAIRPEARAEAEQALHDYASYVRKELAGSSWTVYRDRQRPDHYYAVVRAEDPTADQRLRDAPGTRALTAGLAPLLAAEVESIDCDLVTSSDLQRRHRRL